MRRLVLVSVLIASTLVFGALQASQISSIDTGTPTFDYDAALATSQNAIGNRLSGYVFASSEGKTINIESFKGKPLIISMVYTSCYQICPMTTRHLSKMVGKARDALGSDKFEVAVIGFDTAIDTPQAMQYFGNKQGVSDKGWHLLSSNQADVNALARDIGFLFTPSSNGFDHLIQATILDAEGKVYRQVYGQVFDTPLLVDPLIELVLGREAPSQSFLADLSNKVRLFCTTYDPVRDGYYFDYSLFIGMIIGASIILYTGFVALREYRKR